MMMMIDIIVCQTECYTTYTIFSKTHIDEISKM